MRLYAETISQGCILYSDNFDSYGDHHIRKDMPAVYSVLSKLLPLIIILMQIYSQAFSTSGRRFKNGSKHFLQCVFSIWLVFSFTFINFLQYMGLWVFNWPILFRWTRGYICRSSYHKQTFSSVVVCLVWLYYHVLTHWPLRYFNLNLYFQVIVKLFFYKWWLRYLLWNCPQMNATDDKSTLVQVMAGCRQATSHYLSQCWPWSMSPNCATRPQWVNSCFLQILEISVLLPLRLCSLWCVQITGSMRTCGGCRIRLFAHYTSRLSSLWGIVDWI